ncbi:putative transposase [Phytophthora citrophthora]|uniref:Transposase n=1 Tax=Phytophthora citrophthora TaxID=4793 RepID=A0AAD9GNA9_9STRA|nr:putative transposase [Phytophthora citrophthora]
MCKSVTSKSWFSLTNNAGSKSRKTWNRKNSRRTSSPSSTSSLPDAMERKPGSCGVSDESKPETKESPNSILKTRLYRTPEQKVLLKKMFGTHRTINNKLVEVSKGDCYQFFNIELDQKYMGISQKHSLTEYLPDYHLEVPEEVINETYRDFTKAIKSSRALYNSLKENGKKTTFPSLKFKSRKDNTTSIEVRTRTLSSPATGLFRMLPSYFGFKKTEGMKVLEAIPETNYSIRLQMTRESEFYICTPRVKAFAQTQSGRVCAIDPGVRDFITLYDPGGLTLGVTDGKDKIFQCCLSIDRLQSKLSREHRKRYRYRLKKLIYRIALSGFRSTTMKSSFQIRPRAMLTWSHYKFKVMLADKMERTGGRMIECTEPFTSKTCSKCGRINYNINRQKTFTCPHCNHVLDRDVNAARNIYMMNEHLLTWTLWVQQSGIPTSRC